ncbi:hypothetical protein ACG33_13930 [Steroidobacter denitrificans]|uniref:DUF1318 domain-containing protein n=1 Tax=Steroidobacter denitrificans TaxID=465721 RepID=A0A127FCP2_STEDE|nr:YdbL family protein [Steroidobacter denitrificans]AMN48176.1 hypothetical protein ACG33_13930 [Steroidobacter denitrificans]
MMLRFAPLKLAACCLALSACVTINVYFPAAAAEKAADKIIEDVWGKDAAAPKRDAVPEPEQTSLDGDEHQRTGASQRVLLAAAGTLLDLLVAPAQAQSGPDLNIATPAVRQLTQSMESRHTLLKKYYEAGAVGLTRDGLIEVRDQNLVALPERNTVRKLIVDENADRNNLYREIAVANGHPEWEADIRATFAQRWIGKSSAGWYYQDAAGTWQRK